MTVCASAAWPAVLDCIHYTQPPNEEHTNNADSSVCCTDTYSICLQHNIFSLRLSIYLIRAEALFAASLRSSLASIQSGPDPSGSPSVINACLPSSNCFLLTPISL
jgi:hypothetical protein